MYPEYDGGRHEYILLSGGLNKYLSSLFKNFLFQSEYDNYITKLLDSQTPQHSRLLRDQVEQMSARGTSRPEELQDAKDKVSRLEEEALSLLEENKK